MTEEEALASKDNKLANERLASIPDAAAKHYLLKVVQGTKLPKRLVAEASLIGFKAGFIAAGGMLDPTRLVVLAMMIPAMESSLRNTAGGPKRAYGSHQFIRAHVGRFYGPVYFNDRTNPAQAGWVAGWQIAKYLLNHPEFADRPMQTALFYHALGAGACDEALRAERWKGKSTNDLPVSDAKVLEYALYYSRGYAKTCAALRLVADALARHVPDLDLIDLSDDYACAKGALLSQIATLYKISTEGSAVRKQIKELYTQLSNEVVNV